MQATSYVIILFLCATFITIAQTHTLAQSKRLVCGVGPPDHRQHHHPARRTERNQEQPPQQLYLF